MNSIPDDVIGYNISKYLSLGDSFNLVTNDNLMYIFKRRLLNEMLENSNPEEAYVYEVTRTDSVPMLVASLDMHRQVDDTLLFYDDYIADSKESIALYRDILSEAIQSGSPKITSWIASRIGPDETMGVVESLNLPYAPIVVDNNELLTALILYIPQSYFEGTDIVDTIISQVHTNRMTLLKSKELLSILVTANALPIEDLTALTASILGLDEETDNVRRIVELFIDQDYYISKTQEDFHIRLLEFVGEYLVSKADLAWYKRMEDLLE